MESELSLFSFVPTVVTLLLGVAFFYVFNLVLTKASKSNWIATGYRHALTICVALAVVFVVILSLPIGDATRGQIFSFLGVVMTAAIALSSTTFLGNIMAGLMIKVVKGFRVGDFVRIGDQFGRVSELGFMHTEIQNEDRDLTTLPNLYLVNNPYKVVRSSGTIVSADLSLGYDVPQDLIIQHLKEAALKAGLEDPYVLVMELGDFSVSYRVAGFLKNVKTLISARSSLRYCALQELHGAGIEIVSPNFMNQRVFNAKDLFIPQHSARAHGFSNDQDSSSAESLAFDKADEAESLERLLLKYKEFGIELADKEKAIKKAEEDKEVQVVEQLSAERDKLKNRCEVLSRLIERRRSEVLEDA